MTERGILSALSEQKIRWITYQEFQWDTGKWCNKRKANYKAYRPFPLSRFSKAAWMASPNEFWNVGAADRSSSLPSLSRPGGFTSGLGSETLGQTGVFFTPPRSIYRTDSSILHCLYFLHYTSWMNKGWSCKLIMPNPDLPVQTTWKFVVHRLLPLTTHKVQDLSRTIRCVTRDPAGGKDDVTLTVTL